MNAEEKSFSDASEKTLKSFSDGEKSFF